MKKWTTFIVWALVAAFALFYLVSKPEAAAELVRAFFALFESVGRFFTALAK